MPGFQCSICGETCASSFLRLNGSYFHRHCFRCHLCQCDLQKTGHYKKEGKLYCPKDFERAFGSPCGICNCSISGDRVLALGLQFHRKCFHCYLCRAVFQVKNRILFIGSKFYCKECAKRVAPSYKQKIKTPGSKYSSSRNRTHSLPKPTQENFGEFQEELSQRLAVQYKNCQSHTVSGQLKGNLPSPVETQNPIATMSTAEAVTPLQPVKPQKPEGKPSKVPNASCILNNPPRIPKVLPANQDVLRKGVDSLQNSRVSQLVKVFEKIAENDGKIVDTSLASSVEDSMQFLLESNLQGDSVDPLLLADSSKFDMGDIWASSGSSVQLNDALSVCMTDRETSCQQTRHRRSRRRTRSTHTFKVPVGRGWIPVFRTSTETAHQDVLALSVTVAPKQEDSTSGSAELQELRMDLVSRGVKWSNKIIDQKIIKDKSFWNRLGVTTVAVGLFASVVFNLNALVFNFKDWRNKNWSFGYATKEDLVDCIQSLSLSFLLRIFTP
uniref:LIM zinc-binding domain-containing protein n=2 Tax=Schistocephalus solidus TaxID=70667 RepID=A0A0X3NI87_SCHSO